MEEISTKNQLIRLLYKETSSREELVLKQELSENEELSFEYERLERAYQMLPKVLFNPSESTLSWILGYSRSTAAEHQL